MSKVVSKTSKVAQLNIKGMVDKKCVSLEVDDLDEIAPKNIYQNWSQTEEKPEIIKTLIDQIKDMFDVGKEVGSWEASYYPPTAINSKISELRIPAIKCETPTVTRFIIVTGTREIVNLELSIGSSAGASDKMMVLSGDCVNVKITLAPVMDIVFSNSSSEKVEARKGFRPMVVKKAPHLRHVIVIDGHIDSMEIAKKVTTDLIGKTVIAPLD